MWVRTTVTVERWTKEKTEDEDTTWDESSRGKEKAGTRLGEGFERGPGAGGRLEDPRKVRNTRA